MMNRFNLKGIIFLACSLISSLVKGDECHLLKSAYINELKSLDKKCNTPRECKGIRVRYSSCQSDYPVSRSISNKNITLLLEKLQEVRKACKYIAPPCPRIINQIICDNGKCSEQELTRDEYTRPSS